MTARDCQELNRPSLGARTTRVLALAAILLGGGCCGPAWRDDPPQTQNLATVYNAVDYIRWCFRSEHYEELYEALSPRTQKWIEEQSFGRLGFEVWVGRVTYGEIDPKAPAEVRDVRLVEIVHGAEILNVLVDRPRRGVTTIALYYDGISPAKTLFPLVAVKDAKGRIRWTLGLREWQEEYL